MELVRPALACIPPVWARGPHLQTMAAQFYPTRVPDLPWERFMLDLGDGDALALRALDGSSDLAVALFHGLGGSADGHYMRRTAALLHRLGHSVLAANHRGAGEGHGRAAHTYHSGATGDMAAVLRATRERFPGKRLVAIGFSISANILLLLAGRDRHLELPDLAIAVNPPADLEACSRRLGEGLNRVYDQYFLRRLRAEVLGRPGGDRAQRARTLLAFDEAYTAPQAGFASSTAYYTRCACGPHLAGIEVPTVILTSEDDPFAPAADLLCQPLGPGVHLHVEVTGGHMGYLSRNLPGLRWLDYALDHYVAQLAGR